MIPKTYITTMFIACTMRFRNITEVQDNGKHFYLEEKKNSVLLRFLSFSQFIFSAIFYKSCNIFRNSITFIRAKGSPRTFANYAALGKYNRHWQLPIQYPFPFSHFLARVSPILFKVKMCSIRHSPSLPLY